MSLRHGVRGSGGADIPEDRLDQGLGHAARGGAMPAPGSPDPGPPGRATSAP